MDEKERRKARPGIPENILQRPWISISQDLRATNTCQNVGKKQPIVTTPPPLIWKLCSSPILPPEDHIDDLVDPQKGSLPVQSQSAHQAG